MLHLKFTFKIYLYYQPGTTQPWIIAEKSGNILAAYCNCGRLSQNMNSCQSHSLAINAAGRLEKSRTVTQEASYWMLRSNVKEVTYSKLKDVDFTSATIMKRILNSKLFQTLVRQLQLQPLPFVEPPNNLEMNALSQKLHDTGAICQ